MPFPPSLVAPLVARLRSTPVAGTVPGSLPVLFFGQLTKAKVVSIGINPSKQEFLTTKGVELDGPQRRFETLRSLGIQSRADLDEERAAKALSTMSAYFEPGKPVYSWFQPLERVLKGFGVSLAEGTAAHLDLVQEATAPVWSGLKEIDSAAANALLARDLKFLKWQIESFPIECVVCTSALVLKSVLPMLSAQVMAQGKVARVTWTVAKGSAGGQSIAIAGWNIPLLRPTGLTASDQTMFGALLREKVTQAMEVT